MLCFFKETAKIFSLLPENDYGLLIRLLYGTGMRLMEALRLRIQDIDFGKNEITVHCGKGAKDRKTVLPVSLKFPLQKHLENVRLIHEADCKDGFGSVPLPSALAKKYPAAGKAWAWQWVFPQARRWQNKETGEQGRHHIDPSVIQRTLHEAVLQSGIPKPINTPDAKHPECCSYKVVAVGFHTLYYDTKRWWYENLRTNRLSHFPPLICNAPA